MSFSRTSFHQLLEPLDRRVLGRIVAEHDGNHGVGGGANAWTCQRHLKTMIFSQIAGLGSLREIEQALSARPEALYHLDLRLPRRSTLSDAQAKRPCAVFRDVASHLMGLASRQIRGEAQSLIQLIDASPIRLCGPGYDWAEHVARIDGLKLHLGYDPREQLPDWMDITSPKISDVAIARNVRLTAGTTYVFDKGYLDYSWWHRIDQASALFVSRLKTNSHVRPSAPRLITDADRLAGIVSDTAVSVGHKAPRGGATNPLFDTVLREITVTREGKDPLRLITNDHTRSAAEIAALYKERWQIELFFKWIKQNLKIKRFIGRSENAVKIQIYTAIIAFLLLRMLKAQAAKMHKGTAKQLLNRISVALFSPLNLTNTAKPPPKHPRNLPPSPQFQLNLSVIT